jgi:serine/threonine-protein kinase
LITTLPASCDAVVLRLLSKDPTKRHRDAFHLADDLQTLLEQCTGHGSRSSPPARSPGERSTPAPVSHRPTVHVPTEQDEWRERVTQYQQMFARAYPRGDVPDSLHATMQDLVETLAKVTRLREALDASALRLTGHEDEVRGTRLRIGRALDELVHDESKLARTLDAERKEHGLAEGALHNSMRGLVAQARTLPRPQRAAEVVSEENARGWQHVYAQLGALAEADAHFARIQKKLEEKRFAWDDLRFQIAQLKGRLATLNAESSMSLGHTQDHVQKTETELRLAMEHLVNAAERLAVDLRERPELARTLHP